MKKKSGYWMGMILLSILLFTGCNPLSSENMTVDSWEDTLAEWKTISPKDVEEHITVEVSETYRVDADIRISDELESYEVDMIKLTRHVYEDVEAILEKWIAYNEIKTESEIEVMEKDDILENESYMLCAMVNFDEDEASYAQVRSVSAFMSTPFSRNYGTWSLQNIYDRQALGRVYHEFMKEPSEKELITEMEIFDIKENIETIFEVDYLEDYDLYTCTLERLEQLVEWEQELRMQLGQEENPNERWDVTEADEGTVLCFLQGYKGIPLVCHSPSKDETGASWLVDSYCRVTSSKNGIEGLDLRNPYDIKGANGKVEILSFAELIEQHIIDSQGVDITVVNVGLYYLPIYAGEDLDFIAKPVWYLQVEMEGDLGYPIRDTVLYDAVTGEVIKW